MPRVLPTAEQNAEQNSSLLSDAQLTQVRSVVSRFIEESVTEIAVNAARAAVKAMENTSVVSTDQPLVNLINPTAPEVFIYTPVNDVTILSQAYADRGLAKYGHAAVDIPAPFVKQLRPMNFLICPRYPHVYLFSLSMSILFF